MAYENCPNCGTHKHVLVKCQNCGFSRRIIKRKTVSKITRKTVSKIKWKKVDEEREKSKQSPHMLRKELKIPIRIVSGGLPSLGKRR